MNRMGWGDRLVTISVTATLTSAAWIIAGGSLLDQFGDGVAKIRQTQPAPAPDASPATLPPTTARAQLDREDPHPMSPAAARDFGIPVVGVLPGELTDSFSDARAGGERLHEAIDIMAPTGTRVVAAQTGIVEKIFRSDRGGNTLYIRSPDKRTITYYAHLDRYASGLAEGQRVTRGQDLGTVGASGNASPDAPHLHFAVMQTTPDAGWWEPANAIDPFPLLTGKAN